ncbi:MAG: c-type cytochrome [Gammaproteobacteria bacterium]|nr:c-type cytochrome [Gammaproteobacteria bacterium]
MRGTRFLIALAGLAITTLAIADDHSAAEPSGQAVYEAHCANCHSGGFGGFFTGAPKVGKKKDWKELIPKGVDELTTNTITGIGEMLARGQCETCSDDEIRAAVEYMVEQSQ